MKTCLVKDCGNTDEQGEFRGDLCSSCYEYLAKGQIGPTSSFLGKMKEDALRWYKMFARYEWLLSQIEDKLMEVEALRRKPFGEIDDILPEGCLPHLFEGGEE